MKTRRQAMLHGICCAGAIAAMVASGWGCESDGGTRVNDAVTQQAQGPVPEPKVAESPKPPAREEESVNRSAAATKTAPLPADEPEGRFADNAFPPTIPDTNWHRDAWLKNDCLRCHETGVEGAPVIVHREMPDMLLTAKCRSCHVLIPGLEPRKMKEEPSRFAANAFPPMIPASESHRNAWLKDDCLLCHDQSSVRGAPVVKHEGMPANLLKAKCRSCHVQVRTLAATRDDAN